MNKEFHSKNFIEIWKREKMRTWGKQSIYLAAANEESGAELRKSYRLKIHHEDVDKRSPLRTLTAD